MGECGSCGPSGGGPFSEGRELVEFVSNAHGGSIAKTELPNGGINTKCQGCGAEFMLKTFVDKCPECGGVHAVSPPRCDDPGAVQFAGEDYKPSGQ